MTGLSEAVKPEESFADRFSLTSSPTESLLPDYHSIASFILEESDLSWTSAAGNRHEETGWHNACQCLLLWSSSLSEAEHNQMIHKSSYAVEITFLTKSVFLCSSVSTEKHLSWYSYHIINKQTVKTVLHSQRWVMPNIYAGQDSNFSQSGGVFAVFSR